MGRGSALRRSIVAFVAALAWLAPAVALAWVEVHVARDDVRVEVDKQGSARVEHRVLLLVSGGPLPSFVVRGVDADAEVEAGSYVVQERLEKAGARTDALPLAVTKKTNDLAQSGTSRTDLELTFPDRGLTRGRYVVVFRYRTDLLATGSITHESSSSVLRWVGPAWDDGLDTTRATFVFPLAPTEPRAEEAPREGQEGTDEVLASVSRRGVADTIELVRLYAARGERVVWAVRFDSRALDLVRTEGQPAAPPRLSEAGVSAASLRAELWLALGAGAFLLLAALVVLHGHDVSRRAAERDAAARPLVPLPGVVRAVLAAAALLGGIWLQLTLPSGLVGALLAASFAAFVWYLPSRSVTLARAPGQWLPLSPREAFHPPPRRPRGMFDLRSAAGLLLAATLSAIVGGAAWFVAQRSTYHAVLVAADAVPLLALFLARDARVVPVDLAVDPIGLLRSVVARVERQRPELRVVPRVRLPQGSADADELRVVLLPAQPLRGLRAVEIAMGWTSGPGGALLLPEIILRFEEGTPCADVARALGGFGRRGPGRRLDERVLVFTPKVPTARVTADLALAIVERVTSKGRPAERRAPAASVARRPQLHVTPADGAAVSQPC